MLIRILDIIFAFLGLIVLLPVLILVGIFIRFDSSGDVFYKQMRVGKNGALFRLWKFRTMRDGSDQKGLITVGADSRVTGIGRFLRKFKLDELPQLFNVLVGDMSIVGPRPEVEKYTRLYTDEQRKILAVRPGITDPASIYYKDENLVLGRSPDPEKTYVEEILPHKLNLSKSFVLRPTVLNYLRYILITLYKIVK